MNLKFKMGYQDAIILMQMLKSAVNSYKNYSLASTMATEIAYPLFVYETLTNLHDRIATIVNNGKKKGIFKHTITFTTADIYCFVKCEIPVNNNEYYTMIKQEIFTMCCTMFINHQTVIYAQMDAEDTVKLLSQGK